MDIATYMNLVKAGVVDGVTLAGKEKNIYAVSYREYDKYGNETPKVEGIPKKDLEEERATHVKAIEDIDAFVAEAKEE